MYVKHGSGVESLYLSSFPLTIAILNASFLRIPHRLSVASYFRSVYPNLCYLEILIFEISANT